MVQSLTQTMRCYGFGVHPLRDPIGTHNLSSLAYQCGPCQPPKTLRKEADVLKLLDETWKRGMHRHGIGARALPFVPWLHRTLAHGPCWRLHGSHSISSVWSCDRLTFSTDMMSLISGRCNKREQTQKHMCDSWAMTSA